MIKLEIMLFLARGCTVQLHLATMSLDNESPNVRNSVFENK